jgi:hypothetical protein
MNQVGAKSGCHSNESSPYLTSVDATVQAIRAVKANPADVIVAAIAGPSTPVATELRIPPGQTTGIPALTHSCNYDGAMGLEVADPAVRIQQFLDGFPNRSTFATVCQQDQSDALAGIAQLITSTIGTSCFEHSLADVDLQTPGVQFGCTVADVVNEGMPNEIRVSIPACNAASTNTPCWKIVTDLVNCQAGDHLSLQITRMQAAPPDDHVVADCIIP